jgi:hypothetical protein
MGPKSQRLKRRDGALSSLDAAIEAMNLAKEVSSMTPAKAVFGSVSILLTMIRVFFLLFSDELLQVHMHVTRTRLSTKPTTSNSG